MDSYWILNEYQKMKSTNDISKECGVLTTSIFRYISMIQPNRLILPKVLCIDEFKGDSGGEKYQVNIADGENRKISKEERKNVKYFVSDMNRVFKEIHDVFFPNSIHVIDKYHYVRQVSWALERIRKREQNKMTYKDRVFFKRSKSLLHKQAHKLNADEMIKVADMLDHNEFIRQSYFLKEAFYKYFLAKEDKESARKTLDERIKEAEICGDKEWISCIKTFRNWQNQILNSFECSWTNGYVEGTHNRIKTIKRISFGMPNFKHFRTKILLVFS